MEYRQGNALAMPFEDLSFDIVWSQNVVMNITDRHQLYRQIYRSSNNASFVRKLIAS